ncbi:hypothetical protein KP509_19G059200 [Ceratopteris richardii]|uniref:Uncharacterized protein n=1 Tax=Ceratopteris richardii TaxID=49495 RepID=A0A8T2SMQ0_CERRI|nr:hypothetical protein KP509_19G059200 [Ceratopteris richardii]
MACRQAPPLLLVFLCMLQASLFLIMLLPLSGHGLRHPTGFFLGATSTQDDLDQALDAIDAQLEQQAWTLDESSVWRTDIHDGEELEERHPADAMLARRHVDGSKSYILSGY